MTFLQFESQLDYVDRTEVNIVSERCKVHDAESCCGFTLMYLMLPFR